MAVSPWSLSIASSCLGHLTAADRCAGSHTRFNGGVSNADDRSGPGLAGFPGVVERVLAGVLTGVDRVAANIGGFVAPFGGGLFAFTEEAALPWRARRCVGRTAGIEVNTSGIGGFVDSFGGGFFAFTDETALPWRPRRCVGRAARIEVNASGIGGFVDSFGGGFFAFTNETALPWRPCRCVGRAAGIEVNTSGIGGFVDPFGPGLAGFPGIVEHILAGVRDCIDRALPALAAWPATPPACPVFGYGMGIGPVPLGVTAGMDPGVLIVTFPGALSAAGANEVAARVAASRAAWMGSFTGGGFVVVFGAAAAPPAAALAAATAASCAVLSAAGWAGRWLSGAAAVGCC